MLHIILLCCYYSEFDIVTSDYDIIICFQLVNLLDIKSPSLVPTFPGFFIQRFVQNSPSPFLHPFLLLIILCWFYLMVYNHSSVISQILLYMLVFHVNIELSFKITHAIAKILMFQSLILWNDSWTKEFIKISHETQLFILHGQKIVL